MVLCQRTGFLVLAGTSRELLRDVVPVPLRLLEALLEIANPFFRALQRFSIGRKLLFRSLPLVLDRFEVAAGLLARELMVFGQGTRVLVFAGASRQLIRDVVPVALRLLEALLEKANAFLLSREAL